MFSRLIWLISLCNSCSLFSILLSLSPCLTVSCIIYLFNLVMCQFDYLLLFCKRKFIRIYPYLRAQKSFRSGKTPDLDFYRCCWNIAYSLSLIRLFLLIILFFLWFHIYHSFIYSPVSLCSYFVTIWVLSVEWKAIQLCRYLPEPKSAVH